MKSCGDVWGTLDRIGILWDAGATFYVLARESYVSCIIYISACSKCFPAKGEHFFLNCDLRLVVLPAK